MKKLALFAHSLHCLSQCHHAQKKRPLEATTTAPTTNGRPKGTALPSMRLTLLRTLSRLSTHISQKQASSAVTKLNTITE